MVGVTNVFFEKKSAPNGLKMGSSRSTGVLGTNPASVLLSDFMGSEQTVTNVFLEANMAPNGLKLAPYSHFGFIRPNPSSVYFPDFIWRSRCRS